MTINLHSRELATQIHSIFSTFLTSQPETQTSTYPLPLLLVASKESSPGDDVERFELEGSDIVIGTPGRIKEFLLDRGRSRVNIKELEVLVLDEADRLVKPIHIHTKFILAGF
jgi:superfamily II DNA/RNA helicase